MSEAIKNPVDNWLFEKEIVFEGGAAINVSVGYSNVSPQESIKVISGLGILAEQLLEKVKSLKEVSQ